MPKLKLGLESTMQSKISQPFKMAVFEEAFIRIRIRRDKFSKRDARAYWKDHNNDTLKFPAVINKKNKIDNENSEITTNESDFNSQIISTCQKY